MSQKPLRSILSNARDWIEVLSDGYTGGYCAIASAYLFLRLKEAGYEPVIYITDIWWRGKFYGENHCFVVVNNKILDVTADQFDGPKIALVPVNDVHDDNYYWLMIQYKKYKTLAGFLRATSCWVDNQRPGKHKKYFDMTAEEVKILFSNNH